MDRSQKRLFVQGFRQVLERQALIIVIHQKGLTVSEVSQLRESAYQAGVILKVVKNRLARLCVANTSLSSLDPFFVGSTAVACSADPVAAAKVIVDFIKTSDKVSVVAGCLYASMVDVSTIQMLAALPSFKDLRAQLLALLSEPAGHLIRTLHAPGSGFVRVLKAFQDKF